MKEIKGYVVRSVFSTLGVSLYILADTFFIANGVGTLGLTALNIALPLFSLLNGLGLLLGMGGATLFSLRSGKQNVFSQVLLVGILLGVTSTILGVVAGPQLATLLGASAATKALTVTYLRFILIMGPFFILNNLVLAFIRNDGNPQLAMKAMLASSIFNIIFDYIFVFPMQMGMAGAALATVCSPILSLLILSQHRHKGNRRLSLKWELPRWATISRCLQLGLSSFLTEMSTGISVLVFNLVLLSLAGDVAVAAYGVLANILVVALSLFTGVAQGIQPLVSRALQKKQPKEANAYLRYGLKVSGVLALLMYLVVMLFKGPVIGLFNSEQDTQLLALAAQGIPIYFLALFGSCFNVVFSIFFSAIGKAREAFVVAVTRGYLLLIPAVLLLGNLLGTIGVWSSLPVTEFTALLVSLLLLKNLQAPASLRKKARKVV